MLNQAKQWCVMEIVNGLKLFPNRYGFRRMILQRRWKIISSSLSFPWYFSFSLILLQTCYFWQLTFFIFCDSMWTLVYLLADVLNDFLILGIGKIRHPWRGYSQYVGLYKFNLFCSSFSSIEEVHLWDSFAGAL